MVVWGSGEGNKQNPNKVTVEYLVDHQKFLIWKCFPIWKLLLSAVKITGFSHSEKEEGGRMHLDI